MQRDYEFERGQRRYDEEREGWGRGYPDDRERMSRGYGPERERFASAPRYGASREGWRDYDQPDLGAERRGSGPWDYGRQGYGREDYGRQGPGRQGYERDFDRAGFEQSRYGQQDYERPSERERYQPLGWQYTEAWLIPGPYTGQGPRGYQRSDERIREEVCDRLTQHGRLDASDIQVQVHNSEVTLQGTVDDRQAKRTAEETAESVPGVQDVQNQLRVQRQGALGQPSRFGTFGSSSVQRAQIRPGMDVVGSDANRIGQVKEVRDLDFLVDRAGQRDLYVPFNAVRDVMGDQIVLVMPSSQVENQGWASPALTPMGPGSSEQQPAAPRRRA
jgi:hypothetical protein